MSSLFTYQNITRAYYDCRRNKRNSKAALTFEVNAEEYLFGLKQMLVERTYYPSPSFCFVAKNDKYREIFAASFRDRIVHHLLVRHLEKIWEPVFIYDSYACRKEKGNQKAVTRLQSFMRKITCNGKKYAWFLQLDIRSFFPSVDRKILLDLVLSRLTNEEMRWLATLIIQHDPSQNPIFTCKKSKWHLIPNHKSLFTVAPGKGLPIGNLTSQFFANVYLNPLDQFVKHTLKANYYLRYVDDFVLLSKSKEQLEEWRLQIKEFLEEKLKLQLHPNRQIMHPVSNGIDFLGYIVRPSYLLVRKRTVNKCKDAIKQHKLRMLSSSNKNRIIFPPKDYEKFHATIQSYTGIFSTASCYFLIHSILNDVVLETLFYQKKFRIVKKWVLPFRPKNVYTQHRYFRSQFSGRIVMQVGCYLELFDRDAIWANKTLGLRKIKPRKGFYARCGIHMKNDILQMFSGQEMLLVLQSGEVGRHIHKRVGTKIFVFKKDKS